MRNSIRLGYFADGPWAENALKLFTEDESIEVGFVVPRAGKVDNPLKDLAEQGGIPYLEVRNINEKEVLDRIVAYHCELFVSMSFDQIFRHEILHIAPRGAINCHAGKLPFYRGRNVLNWVLINDESHFGITVHYMDEGVDTGDIILQETFPITDEDDNGSLLQTAYRECARLLHEAVQKIRDGNVRVTRQAEIHPVGSYFGKRLPGDEIIDWKQTSREIFNFIRAIARPGPMAQTHFNGKPVRINGSSMVRDAVPYKSIPGQIVGKTTRGWLVKTSDTILEVIELEYDGTLRIGDRLG
jgi:methionyl-tRNA formyltransferase